MRLHHLLVVALLVACGDDGSGQVDATATSGDAAPPDAPRGTIVPNTLSLSRGNFAEAAVTVTEGDVIIGRFSSDAMFYWNIHGHLNGGTQTLVEEEDVTTVEHTWTAPSDGEFYYMWGNTGVDGTIEIDVELELFGNATLDEWL